VFSAIDVNILPAWRKGYKGKGITIAIVDDGVEKDHDDIRPNFASSLSYDFNYNKAGMYGSSAKREGSLLSYLIMHLFKIRHPKILEMLTALNLLVAQRHLPTLRVEWALPLSTFLSYM